MILERKQRGNRTYLTFFYKKSKKSELKHSIHHYSMEKTSKTTFLSRKLLLLHEKRCFLTENFCCFIKNDIFWQETFVASWKTMFFDKKLLLLHSIKKRNYLLRTDFVNFWSSFASWYSQTKAFQASSSLNTPCGISSGSSPLLLASASLNRALLS